MFFGDSVGICKKKNARRLFVRTSDIVCFDKIMWTTCYVCLVIIREFFIIFFTDKKEGPSLKMFSAALRGGEGRGETKSATTTLCTRGRKIDLCAR